MLQSIFDILQSIGNFFNSLIDFVIGLFNDLIYIVSLLGSITVHLPALFGWLPSVISVVLISLFGIAVIYKVMGRE